MVLQSNSSRVAPSIPGVKRNALQKGEDNLTQALYLQFLSPVKKHLYNFIRKSLNFSPDADDLYQETLLKAFRYFHSFKRDKNFKTWIFTIAHNLVKDYFRKHSVIPSENLENLQPASDDITPSEVRDIYHEAAKLAPRRREVFFLYYYNEFKVPEIAKITGLSRSNVKFILHQCRETLKTLLEVR